MLCSKRKPIHTLRATAEESRGFDIAAGGSAIVNPAGLYLAEPVLDREEIVYATLDADERRAMKAYFDAVGHYSSWDVVLCDQRRGLGAGDSGRNRLRKEIVMGELLKAYFVPNGSYLMQEDEDGFPIPAWMHCMSIGREIREELKADVMIVVSPHWQTKSGFYVDPGRYHTSFTDYPLLPAKWGRRPFSYEAEEIRSWL